LPTDVRAQLRERGWMFALQKPDERFAHPTAQVSSEKTNSSSSATPRRDQSMKRVGSLSIQPDGMVFSVTAPNPSCRHPTGDMTLDASQTKNQRGRGSQVQMDRPVLIQ